MIGGLCPPAGAAKEAILFLQVSGLVSENVLEFIYSIRAICTMTSKGQAYEKSIDLIFSR